MKNLPGPDLTAGYDMGSDSYVWGREFISTRPNHPRDLEIRKHWFNFLLWGRLGYDPDLPPPASPPSCKIIFPMCPPNHCSTLGPPPPAPSLSSTNSTGSTGISSGPSKAASICARASNRR